MSSFVCHTQICVLLISYQTEHDSAVSLFLLQKFKRDPYVATLGGFSKVTNYIFDALRGTEEQPQRPPEEVADLLGEVIPGLEFNQQEEPGFEVITRVRQSEQLVSSDSRGSQVTVMGCF